MIVIPKGTTHEFWKTLHAGTLKAADELGNVEVIWQGPQKEDDRVQQIQLVQNAIAAGVDGIVLAPLDAQGPGRAGRGGGRQGDPGRDLRLGTRVDQDGQLSSPPTTTTAACWRPRRLGELLKGEGKVILLRYAVGSESTEQREKGFTDTLAKEFPRIYADLRHRVRRPDVRLGAAESAEPGDAVPRPGRRDLLPQRVEHVRDAAGPRRGRDARSNEPLTHASAIRGDRAPGNDETSAKSFGATRALDGVSLEVDAGEVRALIGENGAGKSTLMKILSGAYRPDSGSMTLAGEPYAPRGPRDALARGVAMIYQELALAPAPDGRGQRHARPGTRSGRA